MLSQSMVLGPRGWIAVGAWLSLILVPVFHYYWKRWDRPSKAAQEEMARRKHELEVKRAFELEDMKLRAEEAAQAADGCTEAGLSEAAEARVHAVAGAEAGVRGGAAAAGGGAAAAAAGDRRGRG